MNAPEVAFELFFGDLQASPYHDAVRARQGRLSVPPGPGLGLDPDMEVLNRYRLGPPGRDRKLTVCSERQDPQDS
jgi:D-galactarolactone cycloisomerase